MIQTVRKAWGIPELRKKIVFTLLILLIFRLGNAIMVPYINRDALALQMQVWGTGLLGLYNVMSGGVQLMNQIILGIATSRLQEGDPLPSVRQLADTIGINMHTVNKAYSLLRQEGFVTIDRRRGAIIAVDENKIKAMEEMKENLIVALAKGCCRNVSREEVHRLIDEIYDEYGID